MEELFGIIYFLKIVRNILDRIIKKKNRFINYIKGIIAVSISVQLIILPIMIYNYHTISFTFLIANILTAILITIIIIFGLLLGVISIPFFEVSKILGNIYQVFIKIFLCIIEFTSQIPFSKVYVKTPYIYQIIIYYICIFSYFFIKSNCYFKKIHKYKKQIIVVILIIVLIPELCEKFPNGKLKIYFIDVGQGDCSLIITPQNKKLLIDGGGSEEYDIRK